ncbi:la protein homolog isoform X2 [Folsomia candida]|nr:la protein homolog isoform X2 [Folsomia candida]
MTIQTPDVIVPSDDQENHDQVNNFSLKQDSEEEGEVSSDEEACPPQKTEDIDSSSGYGSGNGSSLSGSPVLNSANLKEHDPQNLSSDEHETNGGGSVAPLPAPRRHSDSSDGEVPLDVAARIVAQVESMFSDDHLAKDGFLLKHVRRRTDGFVSLKLVAGLRKVKQISREFPVVLNALKTSDSLEVNADGTKIRRREPLTSELQTMPIKQAKKDKAGPDGDKEKNQAEKENQDDQKLARKRRQKGGDRQKDELHSSDRGNQGPNYKTTNSRRSSISTNDESLPIRRRRGGSLPVAPLAQYRGNYCICPPNPPSQNAVDFLRPNSNGYFEGGTDPAATMSSWLQKRKASNRLSVGEVSLGSGVIRQPRGPDGSKGFHPGYRALMQEERLNMSAFN